MTVDSVSGTTTPQIQKTSTTQLAADFDQFLKLLTTQLQNQDPLSPMDSNEFTNQLVQFSSVEQQIKTNTNLETLLSMQTLNMTALGVSFIGKNVEVEGKYFQSNGTSASSLSYTLPENAKTGTLSILDSEGNVVFSKDAELTAGTHNYVWDGLDQDGIAAPAGKYELRVTATTETGTLLKPTTYVPGYVTGLESADDGSLMLNIGDQKVPLTNVRKIFETTTSIAA